jgi:predicted DNA-binding protein (MmcQ/YjbR family)
MDQATLIDFCRSLPHTTEQIKWDDDLVFSVGGKMFACFHLGGSGRVSFKCTEAGYLFLTGMAGVIPAPYLARCRWVSLVDRDAFEDAFVRERLAEAHQIIFAKLLVKTQRALTAAG